MSDKKDLTDVSNINFPHYTCMFIPTRSKKTMRRAFELAELLAGETLYDLGSGNGIVLRVAARDFNARGVGIEMKKELVKKSEKLTRRWGLEHMIKFYNQDFIKEDINLNNADVVYLYLNTEINKKLIPKFMKLKKGVRIVSYGFKIPGIKPLKVDETLETGNLYLYKTPIEKI